MSFASSPPSWTQPLLSARDLAEAYAQRWEIESCFDELKTHQRGPGTVLRSKTPDGILQEIYGHLCAHYTSRSFMIRPWFDAAVFFEKDSEYAQEFSR